MHRGIRGIAIALSLTLSQVIAAISVKAQEVGIPCAGAVMRIHGRMIATHADAPSAPGCDLMSDYLQWVASADSLIAAKEIDGTVDVRGVRDIALASMLLRSFLNAVVIRGDSVVPSVDNRTQMLHLTMMDLLDGSPVVIGSWKVVVADGTLMSYLDIETDDPAWVGIGGAVFAASGVQISDTVVIRQLRDAAGLRAALGFKSQLPTARYYLGPAADTTLRFVGVTGSRENLSALYFSPPLAVFGPVSSAGGLHRHELLHVVTYTGVMPRARTIPEVVTIYWGGSSNESFADAFCSTMRVAGLDSILPTALDSILAGQWRTGDKAVASLHVHAHVLGEIVKAARDSAWVAGAIIDTTGGNILRKLARHAGVSAEQIRVELPTSLGRRMSLCRQ